MFAQTHITQKESVVLKTYFRKTGCRRPPQIKQATTPRHTKWYDAEECLPILFMISNFLHSSFENKLTLSA